ncbi:MAG TPA: CHRD domain-containing protein [Gemmatimonadaceae bacterium]
MRRVLGVLAGAVTLACSENAPNSPERFVSLASILGPAASQTLVPPILFNTQMRSELESPACVSDSKGHAHIAVKQDGTIESDVMLNNKGDETVRFGHIHHRNPAAATGPIVWWLSSPMGSNLMLTDRQLQFHQNAEFSVTNGHFATHAEALAELLRDPASFYVNFHSNSCPGGFARGFLD